MKLISLSTLCFLALFRLMPSVASAGETRDLTPLKKTPATPATATQNKDEDFDRLDGRGASGKRVDVIEWEGNLEIHVYPKKSLAGLALKLDTTNKEKIVMVIGYRFNPNPSKQLIRRALVSIPFTETFKAYHASTEPDFDKIIISNNGLSGDLSEYKLDPTPTQLYPDGMSKPETKTADSGSDTLVDPVTGKRFPSSQIGAAPIDPEPETPEDNMASNDSPIKNLLVPPSKPKVDSDGTIRPFQW